ncbi:MAG: AbrB/MazE/SpoVT family DNA-binding domain-containing protein [Phycisphaerae bacterium]|nr:AbrB/MazE/SpoVT family DNA-binding domain-containing protein [Phycisphaerae bacterium]
MVTKVQKWGNSQGLRLSRQLLEEARISVGDEVSLAVHDGAIVVDPIRRLRGKHSLRELVKRMPKGGKCDQIDWGGPVGKEVW